MAQKYEWAGYEADTLADLKRQIEEHFQEELAAGNNELAYKWVRGEWEAVKEVEVTVKLRDH